MDLTAILLNHTVTFDPLSLAVIYFVWQQYKEMVQIKVELARHSGILETDKCGK